MKKQLLLLVLSVLCMTARAIPADPTPIKVAQPDGSMLTVKLHGDEFFHFTTTSDGYTVVKNTAGYYTYARLEGDRIVAGDRIARDPAQRTAADRAALASIPKGLTSNAMIQSGTQQLGRRNAAMRRVGAEGLMDYENFRGLIILVNYTDKKFSMPDANAFYDDMVNTHNFTGYTLNGRHVDMTGSVRDYYYDNSNQIFDPHFDIVGPVNVPYNSIYPQGTDRADPIFKAALNAVDSLVNFNDYDSDGDGYVDMVFFLVAGYAANYSGNNENYLWPHMYYLYNETPRDGARFWLYACSTEIAGWEGYYSSVNGIGTFCHEFGHVLGLPDLYDTDYSGSGGESRNPGDWSIMAGGSGDNFGRNPVGYSLYERYALGFTKPITLTEGGRYEMQPLDLSNQGYRLNTMNKDEFFLIENRQNGKWDGFLPGHGMMVARVDSSNVNVWWQNTVNCNPNHMYYELLRARYNGSDSEYDPFPGAGGVTSITNFTHPNLLTWDKLFNEFIITDIDETGNVVSFQLSPDTLVQTVVEDFENMPVTDNLMAQKVEGVYAKWDFSKCAVVSPGEGNCNGQHAVEMKKPSMVSTSSPLSMMPYAVSYTVFNPTSTKATFRLTYSFDKGVTWEEPPFNGQAVIDPESSRTVLVGVPTDNRIMIRITEISGHAKQGCYLDDIKLYYDQIWAPDVNPYDVNGDGEVTVSDINAVISFILNPDKDSPIMERADVNGDGEINIADVNLVIAHITG